LHSRKDFNSLFDIDHTHFHNSDVELTVESEEEGEGESLKTSAVISKDDFDMDDF